ncbi:MAG: type II secretion system protein [Planctomycetota bacterium]|nr:type II secretion system protein [Planctomycetota bacterium]
MNVPARDRPTAGFTLVELLTVMGILGILVALVVGAAHGIRQHAARTETDQTLRAIQAGLSKYYDDWHKYPWYDDADDHPLMGMVRGGTRNEPGYRPLKGRDIQRGDPAAACLYASLAMGERNGPYYTGAGGSVETLAYEDGEGYMVFVDGWGRPVHYFQPIEKPAADRPSGAGPQDAEYYMGTPLLMSEGPQKDMPDMDDTKEDNVYNYPVSNPPADNKYFH